jgi:hypothetical protein
MESSMKKNKLSYMILLGIFVFNATACGDKLIKLSKEDEAAILAYSSAVVSRYNKNQDKGFIRYEEEEKSKEDETKENTSDDKANKDSSENNIENGETAGKDNTSSVSINDALAIEGLTFTSQGTKVVDKYTYGDYVSLMPNSGNSYLVYTVKCKNTSSSDVNLDLLSKRYKYNFTINGTEVVANDTTILLNDLSTYQATLKPNEEVELVLLFQFSASKLSNMTNQSMEMIKGDQTIKIGL